MFGRKPHRLYVFGAGPAGLLVALAGIRSGLDVAVFTTPDITTGAPVKSELHGCQYLHAPIRGFSEDAGTPVAYRISGGSGEDYRRKVYGAGWDGSVSPDEYGPQTAHLAWNLRTMYDDLWDSMTRNGADVITPTQLSAGNVDVFYNDRRGLVVSTIPAPVLCRKPDEHRFITQDIWAIGQRTDTDGYGLPYRAPDNMVECNAADAPRWYRAATVFGYSTVEWPGGGKPPINGVAPVRKPLSTDCDCRTGSPRWHKLGRYGAWQKGVLVHQVYAQALALFS